MDARITDQLAGLLLGGATALGAAALVSAALYCLGGLVALTQSLGSLRFVPFARLVIGAGSPAASAEDAGSPRYRG